MSSAIPEQQPTPPHPRLSATERKRQLIEIATLQFAERGYHETAMDDLAKAAGVSKPVLYQHFRSKKALYLELLAGVGKALESTVVGSVEAHKSPRERAAAGVRSYVEFVARNEIAFRLLVGAGAPRDTEFTAAALLVERNMAAAIGRLLPPELPDDERRLVGHGIVGLAEGAIRVWLTSPPSERASTEEVVERLTRLAWSGLRASLR